MITSKNVRATEEGSQLSRELYLIMVAGTAQGSQLSREVYLIMVAATPQSSQLVRLTSKNQQNRAASLETLTSKWWEQQNRVSKAYLKMVGATE